MSADIRKRAEMNKIVKFIEKTGLIKLPASYRWNAKEQVPLNQDRIIEFLERLDFSEDKIFNVGIFKFPKFQKIVNRFKLVAKQKGYKGRVNYKEMGKKFQEYVKVKIKYKVQVRTDVWIDREKTFFIIKKHPNDKYKLADRFVKSFQAGEDYIEIIDIQETPSVQITSKTWEDVKLKLASAPKIYWQDKNGECMFDQNASEQGTCVIDYLERMSNTKTGKHYRARKTIGDREDIIDDLTCSFPGQQNDPVRDGVSALDIYNYCVQKDLSCYLIDSDQKLRFHNQRKKDTKIPALIALCDNGHLYPITSKYARKSIVEKTKEAGGKFIFQETEINDKKFKIVVLKEEDPPPLLNQEYTIYICKSTEQIFNYYLYYLTNTNIKHKYKASSGGMTQFTVEKENIKFVLNPLYEELKKYIDEPKFNDNLPKVYNPVLEELNIDHFNVKSVFQSEELWDNITKNIVKSAFNYTHEKGCSKDDITIDKNKAYSCVLKNLDYILKCNPSDVPEVFTSSTNIVYNALYFINEPPTTIEGKILINRKGWYTQPIISKALEDKHITPENITHILPCSSTEQNPYVPFIDTLYKEYKNDAKLLINYFIGNFGRTHSDRGKLYITKELDHIVSYDEKQFYEEKKIKPITIGEKEHTYYITQVRDRTKQYSTSVILNAQIVQQNRLTMYNMAKRVGGILKAVKTDAITVSNPSWKPPHEPDNIDGWKIEKTKGKKPPSNDTRIRQDKPEILSPVKPVSKIEYRTFKDEWNTEECAKELHSVKGNIFLDGQAGTGKTHLVKKLVELDKKHTFVIAPTHCAKANYVKSETIHSFLCVDIYGNQIGRRNYKPYHTLILDECSMIGSNLFSKIIELSQLQPHIKFILVGDFKQLDPVNDSSSLDMWKYFINHHYELQICKRAENKETFDINKKLRNYQPVSLDTFNSTDDYTENKLNLCHTNAERRYINNQCIKKYACGDIYNIIDEVEEAEAKEDETEETIKRKELHTLYKGMPIMLLKTIQKLKIYNGYMFEVIDIVEKEYITIKRINNWCSQEYDVGWNRLKDFVPCYCMTIHKSQGQTFTQPYTIHGYEQLNPTMKYVAVSRCKKIEQISITK